MHTAYRQSGHEGSGGDELEADIKSAEGHRSAWSRFDLMSLMPEVREVPDRLGSYGNRQRRCWIKLNYDSGAAGRHFPTSFAADAVGQ